MIGLRDARLANPRLFIEREPTQGAAYASTKMWQADLARWPVQPGVDATGTLPASHFSGHQVPCGRHSRCRPNARTANWRGHETGTSNPWAARLAAVGGEVIVTTPISRQREARKGRAVMTDQEFLYRSAFELGRHVLGYQVNETLAAIEASPPLPQSMYQ